eukprot:CAMPEP_0119042866 /NCGR_PEP_ID=MMETSP1177-20130426/16216_1 /TAXON_ID=2985 /ORGANISM="Ochromonas sp, Strain CCMP1899" /LENGTH=225 /DNA_ID=CAMNT_0007009921 /DNA_START=97 /DNA_END=775 /DNA_ORIENTATION=+
MNDMDVALTKLNEMDVALKKWASTDVPKVYHRRKQSAWGSATNLSSSCTENCANKEPRRSSSPASCVYGEEYEAQLKEYGLMPIDRSDAPQDSSASVSLSSSASSSDSSSSSLTTIEPIKERSTQAFLAVVTRDRSAIGDYCEVDDVRDPPYNPNTKENCNVKALEVNVHMEKKNLNVANVPLFVHMEGKNHDVENVVVALFVLMEEEDPHVKNVAAVLYVNIIN